MNRFWAGLFALMVSGLAATVAQAATIEVTTFGESGDNDDLCSIREATGASSRANLISARKSSRAQLVTDQETLARNFVRLKLDSIEHYPKSDLLEVLRTMRDDLIEHVPVTPAEIAARDEILNFLVDPDPLAGDGNGDSDPDDGFIHLIEQLPDNKAYYREVAITLDLIEDQGAIDFDVHDGDGSNEIDPSPIGTNDVLQLIDDESARLDRLNDIDGCANGTSFDTIVLKEGTYTLTNGEVVIQSRLGIRGIGETSIIQAGSGARHFRIPDGISTDLELLQLTGGDAGAGNGGAIIIAGSLTVNDVLFNGNTATNGGAIFIEGSPLAEVSGGSLTISRSKFINNTAAANGGAIAVEGADLGMTDVVLGRVNPETLANEGNAAAGLGGAIYFSPLKDGGSFAIERGSVVNNTADIGAAFYVGGEDVGMVWVNLTITRNAAGNQSAIEVTTTDEGSIAINNVTLVANTAGAGIAGVRVTALTAVVVANSLIADNIGGVVGDCQFLGVVDPLDFNRNYYGVGTACPGPIYNTRAPDPADTNFQLTSGTAIGYLLNPFDEELGFYVPVYPNNPTNSAEIRLVNRGAGILEPFRCVERDQRNRARASVFDDECDIGAVEYQTGRPIDDEISILIDESTCIEVITNDVGDANYIVGTLEVIDVERDGATAEVVARTACPNAADMDPDFPDAILFTPARGFHGETNITYSLQWEAGPAPTQARGVVSGLARVTTQPASGIKSSSLGHFGLGALGCAGLLALRRRVRTPVVVLSGLVMLGVTASVPAVDNIIYVTTGADNAVVTNLYGDGECSLREALAVAQNDQENLTDGDCLDGNEGPDVIEILVPVVTLAGPVQSFGGVTIRCPLASSVPCILQGNSTFRLIDAQGSLGIDRMILQGGNAGLYDGGAIFSNSGVSISNSIVRDNSAHAGGAVFLQGIRGDLTIANSLFMGNASTGGVSSGGGGVAAMSAFDSHKVTVSNSTFYDNAAVFGPAVFDVNTTSTTVIANSTFSQNNSEDGSGALDFADAMASVTLRNLTVVGNISASGFAAIHFGSSTSSHMVANSVISNNHTDDLVPNNANCQGTFNSSFNLYGEGTGTVTCVLPVTNNTNLVRDPALVFDGVGPDDLAELNLAQTAALLDASTLAEDGFIPPHHIFADPKGVDGILVDAGYDDGDPDTAVDGNLSDSLEVLSGKCADVDLRGKSRQSGGRCDIGAWEWVQVTALADQGSNVNRNDRIAIIDVLANDLFEDGQRCIPDTPKVVDLVPADGFQEVQLLQTTGATDLVCVQVRFPTAVGTAQFVPVVDASSDDEPERRIVDESDIVGADPESEYEIGSDSEFVLAFSSAGDALITEDDPLLLDYFVGDNIDPGQNFSAVTQIEVSVLNAPPQAESDEVAAPVGKTVVIDVLANDIDRDAGLGPASDDVGRPAPTLSPSGLQTASVRITGGACTAVESALDVNGDGDVDADDVDYWQCQFGKARVNRATGAITWTPDSSYNPFTETFGYEVSDYAVVVVAGPGLDEDDPLYDRDVSSVSTASVTIRMKRPSANGGSILGEDDLSDMLGIDFLGTTGNLFFLALGLSALRRRSVPRRR